MKSTGPPRTVGPEHQQASPSASSSEKSLKRRRRAFSCLSCQKLKCRCEYDPGAPGCHRCQTLRIECSLRQEHVVTPPNPAPELAGPDVEERFRRYEDELRELKSMVKHLTSKAHLHDDRARVGRESPRNDDGGVSRTDQETPSPEYFSSPADKGTQSAPVVVLRGISQQITKGYRRLLEHIDVDLVQLQLLDEQTAVELIQLFHRHQGHNLLVCGVGDLTVGSENRRVSAFLHSVCCLMGIVYRDDMCGHPVHRQIYEQVRVTLGQALLSSPLNLEEINAILIMSNNANGPNSSGAEYVDSWLLTGYCAKQAMLSISFSRIIDNIKRGNPTAKDHGAIHLWSRICLHHLHWAATTGRPSIIPTPYVNQCNILLSFYQATMQDGMLVAEISLYSVLHQKLAQQSALGDGDECEEFLLWKEKWKHLLGLGTSSMLRIGYHAACLILAVRSLEESGHALRPRTFLSEADGDNGSDDEGHTLGAQSKETRDNDGSVSRANACKYAVLVLETFLEMPSFLMDAIPTCLCLCIGYCAITLAHYDESQSKVSDQVSIDLITRINQWIRTSPGKAWSFKYGALAKQKIESRINDRSSWPGARHTPTGAPLRERGGTRGDRTDAAASSGGPTSRQPSDGVAECCVGEVLPPTAQNLEAEPILSTFDIPEDAIFPSMEDFFGGGFLDFLE
ncbi:hypothetical protein GGS23DRAFT_607980 [Durotheca rogersii]|uniref:uncharacterized protein n=1 Tax=Durotheca rogersii TaxID=419775 RepID=UPI0022211FE1|nr:uncharacterized protein GGS23DRAFT_607980 [Durotheca rogersii]KAI5856670.1 hypothetical protein GGS23DRAFT_607980 [Durotheca rogersii]